jgi:glycosyltransferase involved in cell wall biosynthesis
VTHFLNRLSLYFYNGIIFQTEQQRNMFKPKPYRSITVSNSFDDSIPIEVKKDEHKNKDIMVLWVNNIKKNKNPEAFIQLSEMCIGNDYRFVMIGYPDNIGVSTSIKQKEKTLSNFQYIPGIPYDSILKYFFKASVFIITSFQEGFPNVIIQAMKTQTPIISLYVDPDNCFSQKGTGILSYNINQMKKDLDYIIENKDMYKRIQRKQFHYANKNFELKRNFTKLNMFLS